MILIDMRETFIPSLKTLFLKRDDGLAESTPESSLSVPADAAEFALLFDVFFIVDLVV